MVATLIILGAIFAPGIALVNPYDLASFSLFDGLLPPVWQDGANPKYLLGTDDQGRDMISAILYGARLSLSYWPVCFDDCGRHRRRPWSCRWILWRTI